MAPELVEMFRRAFDSTVKDPAYLADAEKLGLGVDAMTGEEVAGLIDRVYAMPKTVVEKAAAASKGR